MPADTPTEDGHAIAVFARGTNDFGAKSINWTAQCGATGTTMAGAGFRFLRAGSLRRLELCPKCFPGRNHNACDLAKPVDLSASSADPSNPPAHPH